MIKKKQLCKIKLQLFSQSYKVKIQKKKLQLGDINWHCKVKRHIERQKVTLWEIKLHR